MFLHYFKKIKFASYQKCKKQSHINYDITRDPSKIFRLF
jgi:hypothetical protein